MATFGELNPKGEMTCFQCEQRHVAEYHHEGRFNEGSIYIVICTVDNLADYYTADVIDFDEEDWTLGVAKPINYGLDLTPREEKPEAAEVNLDRVREIAAAANRAGDTRPSVDHPEVYAMFLAVPKLSEESHAIINAWREGWDAEMARPIWERSSASIAVEMRNIEGSIEAARSELAKTNHARRKASLRRSIDEMTASLSRLMGEYAAAQDEGR